MALAPVSASTQEALIRKAREGKERSRAKLRPIPRSAVANGVSGKFLCLRIAERDQIGRVARVVPIGRVLRAAQGSSDWQIFPALALRATDRDGSAVPAAR